MRFTVALLSFLALILGSCRPSVPEKIENLSNGKVLVLGHGGSGFKGDLSSSVPNSKESIQKALLDSNADGVEVDVQLTLDGKLILFHDETLDNKTNCSGVVSALNSSDLKHCKYESTFGEASIWYLDSLFAFCNANRIKPKISLDMKFFPSSGNSVEARTVAALLKAMGTHGFKESCLLESGTLSFLEAMEHFNPAIETYLYVSVLDHDMNALFDSEVDGMSVNMDLVTDLDVKKAHDKGFKVMLWGLGSDRSVNEALHKHPDVIQTDDLDGALDLVNRIGS